MTFGASKLERILILDLTTVGEEPSTGKIVESAGVLLDLTCMEVSEARSIRATEFSFVGRDGLAEQSVVELLFAMARSADAFVAHGASRLQRWLPRSLVRTLPWICSRFGCDWSFLDGAGEGYGAGLPRLAEGQEAPSRFPPTLGRCLSLASVMREVREAELGLHAPELRTILERGLARGVGEPPRCEHEGCPGYARTYLRDDVTIRHLCIEHGGSWQWIS